jgi:hypothetical protein
LIEDTIAMTQDLKETAAKTGGGTFAAAGEGGPRAIGNERRMTVQFFGGVG